jgi:hypothetical protein
MNEVVQPTFEKTLSMLRAVGHNGSVNLPWNLALSLAEEIERLRGIVAAEGRVDRETVVMDWDDLWRTVKPEPIQKVIAREEAAAIRNAPDEKIVMWMDVTEEITFFDAVSAKAHNFVESTGALRSRACWQSMQHDAVQVEVYETADSPTLFSVFVHRSESPDVVVERLRAGISKWLYGPAPESVTDEADLLALPPGNVVHPAPPMSSTIESYKCLCLRVHTIPLLQRTFQCPCGESHVRDEGGVWRLATPESEGDALLRFFKGEE